MNEHAERQRLAAEHQAMRLRVLRECLDLRPLMRAIEPDRKERERLFRVPDQRTRVS